MMRVVAVVLATGIAAGLSTSHVPSLAGPWRAVLDQAGGSLRFSVRVEGRSGDWSGSLCNGPVCQAFSAVASRGDSAVFEMADYDAALIVLPRGDSLLGYYRNVGNRGPRTIPFRAARGVWPVEPAGPALVGPWDATFNTDGRLSPRVIRVANGATGIEAGFLANSGDYGLFWGSAAGDSLDIGHFDGTFVFRLTGKLDGDTLRGLYHAGLRTQTPFVAVRSTGRPHLRAPTEITGADTTGPFRFAFPRVDGGMMTQEDPRFRGKVVLVDIFGSWCSTCHDAAPALVELYREFRGRGFEIVGLAYEVSGDSAVDGRLVRRFRDKFGIGWPLLLAGTNLVEATAATLPQLRGFTAYPTSVFLGRDVPRWPTSTSANSRSSGKRLRSSWRSREGRRAAGSGERGAGTLLGQSRTAAPGGPGSPLPAPRSPF
jgi:thiol-disulfide isomerase/thioredoxin